MESCQPIKRLKVKKKKKKKKKRRRRRRLIIIVIIIIIRRRRRRRYYKVLSHFQRKTGISLSSRSRFSKFFLPYHIPVYKQW